MNAKKMFTHKTFFLAFILIMLSGGCTQTSLSYGIVGTPAVSADGKYMTILVAESRGTTRQVNGGYRATDYSTAYWLKQYETASGKLVKKRKIVTNAEAQNLKVSCYGGCNDKIWLQCDELIACNINGLQEVVNEEMLFTANNLNKDNFPDDGWFIEEQVSKGFIYITGTNGTKYSIDLNTLKIGSKNDPEIKTADDFYNDLQRMHSGNKSCGSSSYVMDEKIFIIAKDSSTAINIQPGNNDEDPVYANMTLFTAGFTTSSIATHTFYRFSNMHQLPGAAYLNGRFLKDVSSNQIIKAKEPGIFYILHNINPGNNAQSVLTCIDSSNKPIWQLNTGLSTTLANCIAKDQYCIMIGNKHPIISPPIGSDMLCIIHLASGKMHTVSIEN